MFGSEGHGSPLSRKAKSSSRAALGGSEAWPYGIVALNDAHGQPKIGLVRRTGAIYAETINVQDSEPDALGVQSRVNVPVGERMFDLLLFQGTLCRLV